MKDFRIVESSPVALYAQAKQILRERVSDGTYEPHAQLPAESEMGSIFGVSRLAA
jgi:GntR family transcriptional regulator